MMLGMVWGAIPATWRAGITIALLLALVGTIGGAYLYIRHQAYQDGYSTAAAACERQKEAQRQANEAAIRKVEEDLFEAADKLSIRNMEIEDALSRLRQEALADPSGSAACLGLDSVRRLNAIQ